MASFSTLFSHIFDLFSRRKTVLYASTIVVILGSLFILKNIHLSEDIQPMLPDGKSAAAADFHFLQQAPFVQKVVFNLKMGPGMDRKGLAETSDKLANALGMPYYSNVITGPKVSPPEKFFPWLLRITPALMGENDLQAVLGLLTSEHINAKIGEIREKLNSPEGWAMRSLLQEDPLQLYLITLNKLRFLNMFKDMVLKDNHFISRDGRNALIIAETPIKFTDTQGAKDLIRHTKDIINTHTVTGASVSFLSGHSYTAANAETIKEDLFIILTCASLAILVLLFIFMRNWRAIFVFLVPASVVCIATAGILLVNHAISAITIAFGSVLMGIADDYPIFAYFSLKGKGAYSGEAVGAISKPVIFSGITTMGTFSALFFSDLPGQRQIALFSIIGIVASLAFSLIVLPHLIRGLPHTGHGANMHAPPKNPLRNGLVIGGWLLATALCLWQMNGVRFNGDMRSVSMVPPAINKTEAELKEVWGDFRGAAMVFTEGGDLQSALLNNDRLFAYLKGKIPDEQLVSLAPVLPAIATQEANLKLWERLWDDKRRNAVRDLFVKEGEKSGFTSQAFDPFFKRLSNKPTVVTVEMLKQAGIGDIVDSLIMHTGNTTKILTLVPDTPETAALFSNAANIPFVARFVSQRRFNDTISTAMIKNFIIYIVAALTVILLFLIMLFRSFMKVFYALVPVITGLIFMFGVMGLLGMEFNLFNIIATILVIGLSVDLGIFMVSRLFEGHDYNTSMAVLLGGLTSLVGMGALVLARHPALYSIGVTVLLGMCGAIPAALFVIPALYASHRT